MARRNVAWKRVLISTGAAGGLTGAVSVPTAVRGIVLGLCIGAGVLAINRVGARRLSQGLAPRWPSLWAVAAGVGILGGVAVDGVVPLLVVLGADDMSEMWPYRGFGTVLLATCYSLVVQSIYALRLRGPRYRLLLMPMLMAGAGAVGVLRCTLLPFAGGEIDLSGLIHLLLTLNAALFGALVYTALRSTDPAWSRDRWRMHQMDEQALAHYREKLARIDQQSP